MEHHFAKNKCVMPNEMIILAGGFGTRLRSVVKTLPKPMAPVSGRPFLSYLFDHWISQGIQRFIISTGYLGNAIKDYYGVNYKNASIEYVHEEKPLGTGGALRYVLDCAKFYNDIILMINGDTWFPVNLEMMCNDAEQQLLPIILSATLLEKNDRYSSITISPDGRVDFCNRETSGPTLINAGCYMLNISIIKKAIENMHEVFSFEKDFLPAYAASHLIGSSVQYKSFLDIGIPSDYLTASKYLTSPGSQG